MIRHALVALLLASTPAAALELSIPGGVETRRDISPADSVRLPTAPWSASIAPQTVEGSIRKRVLRIGGGGQTTLQLLSPLRDALRDAGYTEVFACESLTCGGFDFRFQLDLLGEPEMHVDLGDFRYLLMQGPEEITDAAHHISLVVSRDAQAGYVHITEVFPADIPLGDAPVTRALQATSAPGTLPAMLEANGHAVLDDLDFGSGASDLGPGTFQSLDDLASWLTANPTFQIAIVGHTDAVGSLAANTALSERRATSVRARLIDEYGVNADQTEADGAGYLAPIASNLTEAGRAANRRVEVIVLSN